MADVSCGITVKCIYIYSKDKANCNTYICGWCQFKHLHKSRYSDFVPLQYPLTKVASKSWASI